MLDNALDSKQKRQIYQLIKLFNDWAKVYKSESNNLIMFIAVSLVLGLSIPVLDLVFCLSYLSLLCVNIYLLNQTIKN